MANLFETERLSVRFGCPSDAVFVHKLLNDPLWIANIGDKNVSNIIDAEDYINRTLVASYKSHGFGLYILQIKSTEEPIGLCGLVNRDSLHGVDLGYALLPQFRNKGYAFEATKATLQYDCSTHNIEQVLAITLPSNVPSKKLLEKIGFEYTDELVMFGDEEILDLYRYQFESAIAGKPLSGK